MCEEIKKIEYENYENSLYPQIFYRTGSNVKSELTVSNLIQFIPNLLTFDFELTKNDVGSEKELPQLLLPQSLSFMRAQSLMQSLSRSMNHRTIKMNLNIEKEAMKKEETIKESFNLCCKYDINLIYSFYINSFIKKMNRILERANFSNAIKENELSLKILIDREIDANSNEYEEQILLVLETVLDNLIDVFETFFKMGNMRDFTLIKALSSLNFGFDNEHNPVSQLLASFIFKYLRVFVVKFDLNSTNEEDFIVYSDKEKSFTVTVKVNEIPNKKEKSIMFLGKEDIYRELCSNLIKKELIFLNESFNSIDFKNTAVETVYDNSKLSFSNTNVRNILNFLYEKKYFKKIEFINKIPDEEISLNYEQIIVCLALFEQIFYLTTISFKLINVSNKNMFTGASILRCVIDLKSSEPSTKDVVPLNLDVSNMNFLKLITSNFNTIEGIFSHNTVESPFDCTISYNDSIIPIKKDTNFIKIKVFSYPQDLNDYLNRVKIPNKNLKLRSILLNSNTLESFVSASVSYENEDKFFEITFTSEKASQFKPQKYLLTLYVNNFLIWETQILLIKIGGENSFFPIVNPLFNYSKVLLLGANGTVLFNNAYNSDMDEMKESFDTPKLALLKRNKKNKDFREYADFKIEFRPMKIDSKTYCSNFVDLCHSYYKTQAPQGLKKASHAGRTKIIVEKIGKRKKITVKKPKNIKKNVKNPKNLVKKSGKLGPFATIVSKWLNSNNLLVSFSCKVVSELLFSFEKNLPEPLFLIYNLKENEFENSKTPIIFHFETSILNISIKLLQNLIIFLKIEREIFYPYSRIFQMKVNEMVKPIENEELERKKEKNEQNIEYEENFFMTKMNIPKYYSQLNSTKIDIFFNINAENIFYLDAAKTFYENEKEMLEKEQINSILNENILSIVNEKTKTQRLFSFAGETRTEFVKFYDSERNEIQFKEKDHIEIVFVHTIYPEIRVIFPYDFFNSFMKIS